MSLYDDIEPTVKRPRTFETPEVTISVPEKKYETPKFGPQNMFAPRTLMTKKSTDPKPPRESTSSIGAPTTLQSVPVRTPVQSIPLPTPVAPQPSSSEAQPIDLEAIKSQIKQKRMEMDKSTPMVKGLFKNVPAPAAPFSTQTLPALQARKVDMSKLKEITVVPTEMTKDSTEYLFDEVHIIDEYNPSKPNEYLDFMRSINCNPMFGEEIDDSKLERLIINEIINGQKEKAQRTPSPELEEEKLPQTGPSVIANIMAKMGYTEGSGLGKHGQGMSSALRVEKKAGIGGRIVSEIDEVMMSVGINPDEFTKPVSNVLLLRNMYINDDIPDDYEAELRPELSQYGHIRRIYLHPKPEAEDELEQVRIFVEYANKATAVRAYADLNQRFFSERLIRADFYPTEKFALGQYNDDV